jgi:hypothetical protein
VNSWRSNLTVVQLTVPAARGMYCTMRLSNSRSAGVFRIMGPLAAQKKALAGPAGGNLSEGRHQTVAPPMRPKSVWIPPEIWAPRSVPPELTVTIRLALAIRPFRGTATGARDLKGHQRVTTSGTAGPIAALERQAAACNRPHLPTSSLAGLIATN